MSQILDKDTAMLREIVGSDDLHLLFVAQRAVREGALEVLTIFKQSNADLETHYKKDDANSPVTIADVRSGEKIRNIIKMYYPDYSINEEESGIEKGSADGIFFVDPLDGTSSFTRWQPFSTTGVIVYEDGRPLVASVCDPFDKKLYIAQKGRGAYEIELTESLDLISTKSRRLHVSSISDSNERYLFIDSTFNPTTREPKVALLSEAARLCKNIRSIGSNINHWAMVASGRTEAAFTDAVGGHYDLSGVLLVMEAGGFVANLAGNFPQPGDQLAIAANSKELLDSLVAIAQKSYPADYDEYGFRGKK